ncbi:mRNA-decapping enzyme 1A [Wickerhamomyces ciferrii]|uniref:mRNA-decapping enzyme 1A n=1 Tax=Wickerhamomyces ciferrii (strain ATCC 14091 / BCRC 22168 / CBS 111 / JCM 3599 / NBRC 0793 / NRRL Y-1031 F-60-10) TaxID=1206466 RepID=K0KQA9_WICCF|nr:mRNA-decapping enzyme 1A [Wickerhamomyces ciferrii]CCH43594.1 mRNA-decapping enzyme 1A [Wickerhamomyces ciferrii]
MSQIPSTTTTQTPTPPAPETVIDNEFSLYTKTLTFNVIGRYDPKIDRLLYHTSHCVVYKFNDSQDWEQTDYQGVMAVYTRKKSEDDTDVDDIYDHGIIIMNRNTPENFSLGLLSKNDSRTLGLSEIKTEYQTDYIIIKNLEGEIFGFWVHEEQDREGIFALIKAIVDRE